MELNGSLWLCVVVCLSQAWSMPTKCARYQWFLVEKSLDILENLGKRKGEGFNADCIKDNVVTAFPEDAFLLADDGQEEDIQVMVYETLQSIQSLFEKGRKPKKWDEFRGIVHRQLQEFKTCGPKHRLGSETIDPEDINSSDANRRTLLKAYFEKMKNILKEKNYRPCAWEVIRKELRLTFYALLDNIDSLPGARS
ncbi:interferon a3-like [Lepisosteus oculatus]|uniref:interferon a3-like n=1 Tax=Lepisosteus oculatus TaxID=7918 RepID=UPI0037240407